MKNLGSVFAAYMAAWGIFFVYYLTIAGRALSLRRDIDRIKNSAGQGK
ncbi:MAG: hypothetical protein WBE13_05010 [Candidatus Acidiferrum sp.]|jgi:hypothetical protein